MYKVTSINQRLIGILILLTIPFLAFAQSSKLSGKVLDAQDKTPLIGAHVKLMDLSSQTSVSTVVDKEGSFTFTSIRINRIYKISISFVGYESLVEDVVMDSPDKKLKPLLLNPSTEYLKEVEVKGVAERLEQKGDTTIYNADAFKTAPDASAEDLLKKMPGITSEGGTIKAQGEEVKRVLVDGKRFFGDDPNMAMRNLPAEIIEKVQVFDQMSDQSQFTGFDDGESVRTINIITRNRVQNGQFGRVTAGYGYNDKYAVGGNMNFFKEDNRWTILGQTNNVNQQNFSNEDLMGMMGSYSPRGGFSGRSRSGGGGPGGRSGGGMYGGFGGAGNFMVGSQNGITTTHAFGVNYSGKPHEKLEVNGSYFFNKSNNERIQESYRNYFLTGMEDVRYLQDQNSLNSNLNHRLNLRVEYEIDSSNSIIYSPRISFQGYDSEQNMVAEMFKINELLSDTLTNSNSLNNGFNISNDLLYRHRFAKPRRTISISLRNDINTREGEQFQLMGHPFYGEIPSPNDTSFYRQRSDNATLGYSYNANINYTEPVGKIGMLQFNYGASYNDNNSDRYTYRYIYQGDFGLYEQDSLFSNVYTSDYLTNQLGVYYRISKNALNLSFGLDQQWAKLLSDREFPVEYSLDKNFSSVLPSASLSYRFKNRKSLSIRYRTRTNSPSINNLQDVIDNSNPTRLSVGNPALEQEYRHDMFARFGGANAQKATSFFVFLGGGFANNSITRATTIAQRDTVIAEGVVLPRFGEISKPVNLNGYWNIRSFSTYGMPVKLLKSNLNINASLSFSRTPGMTNNIMNYSNTVGIGSGFTLSSNISEKVDFSVTTMINYNIENNTIQQNNNFNYWSQSSSARFSLIFLKNMVLRSDIAHQMYSGLSDGFNQSYYVWNLSLARKVFKNKNGEFRFSVMDVLNNNQSISHSITESYIEDMFSNVLSRYSMLSFTYNIRNYK